MSDEHYVSLVALGDRITALANELLGPLLCTQPAGGLGPGTHGAACCYGTGVVITCDEDRAVVDAADLLAKAAAGLYVVAHIDGSGA